MNAQTVTAVIPVFNNVELLTALLDSISSQTVSFTQVLVIDNGSSDQAPATAEARGCRVIRMGYNSGFAKAVNRGWREAASEWVAVLNSDVVLAPDWLEQCLLHAAASAYVAGKLLRSADPRILDGTYDLISRAGCAWRAGNGQPDDQPLNGEVSITFAPATATLYRVNCLRAVQGFDESFESYLEDVDLGFRFARAGFRGVYVPSACATHRGSATLGRWNAQVVRLIARNQVLLLARHYDRGLIREWLWAIAVGQLLWGLLALRHGAGIAWVAGKWEGLRDSRPSRAPVSAEFRSIIEASEDEIRRRSTDWYWAWYFRLSGRERSAPFEAS